MIQMLRWCLNFDVDYDSISPTVDAEIASSIPTRSHTFVEIDHEIIRGSFFMFVESGCISTNIEFTVS